MDTCLMFSEHKVVWLLWGQVVRDVVQCVVTNQRLVRLGCRHPDDSSRQVLAVVDGIVDRVHRMSQPPAPRKRPVVSSLPSLTQLAPILAQNLGKPLQGLFPMASAHI